MPVEGSHLPMALRINDPRSNSYGTPAVHSRHTNVPWHTTSFLLTQIGCGSPLTLAAHKVSTLPWCYGHSSGLQPEDCVRCPAELLCRPTRIIEGSLDLFHGLPFLGSLLISNPQSTSLRPAHSLQPFLFTLSLSLFSRCSA